MNFQLNLTIISSLFFVSFSAFALSDDNRPEYQKEYEAYMRDLGVIAQTGKAPKNIKLEADLAKMDSNEKIRLTVHEPVKTSEIKVRMPNSVRLAQLDSKAEIVNTVEVIRIPEEFKKEYASLYEEAISAQDLAEQQNFQRKRIIDEDAMKIADHINPFRFLKEVKLSPLPGEYGTKELPLNPMVNAYFNQFGRPYVHNETEKNENEDIKNKKETSVGGSLGLRKHMFVD